MKVRIDGEVCGGFGVCNSTLSEVFDLNELGFGEVIGDGTVQPEHEELARTAIERCPTQAIEQVDSDT